MLNLIISILGILITIFFVVGTHEFGHFATARLLGVKVLRFSVGFGKRLFHWHDKSGTEYVFALLPFGGYVQMLDENEGPVSPEEVSQAYNVQPFYKKCLIVVAGPLTNILCAFLLYWLTFVIGFHTLKPIIGEITPNSIAAQAGVQTKQEIVRVNDHDIHSWTGVIFRLVTNIGDKDPIKLTLQTPGQQETTSKLLDTQKWQVDPLTPDPLKSLGITPYFPDVPMIIGIIQKDAPAVSSGLKIGDKILMVDDKPIKDWSVLIEFIQKHPDTRVTFKIERNQQIIQVPVMVGSQREWLWQKSGYLGIAPQFTMPKEILRKIQYHGLDAIQHAWQQIVELTYFNFIFIKKLLMGQMSVQSLGGPITIFSTAGSTLNVSVLSFIAFLAFLSLSLGVINLLPIPGLDGGHLVFQVIEAIIGKPIPNKVMAVFYYCGFLLIIFVFIQSMVNDILRL